MRRSATTNGLVFHIAVAVVLIAIAPRRASCQSKPDVWMFRDLPYYEPLMAEPRAARVELTLPAFAKQFPHSDKPGNRFAWQITLGRELPIVGVRSEKLDGRVGKGKWGLGLWTPVSFHMIEDFKDESAPIVDTDYRFGTMVKFQYGIKDDLWLGVKFVPWAHESTHLGDEYTIIAQLRDANFKRVNPSFEYHEYGISIEKVFDGDRLHLIARHGGINLWGKDGYYSDHLLGEAKDAHTLTPSEKNYEPSFGFEVRGRQIRSRHPFASVDTRHKLIYAFDRAPGESEQQQWSMKFAAGLAAPEGTRGIPLKAFYLHYYRGVNPYGQLRAQKDFWTVGLGFIFGV
ncbi:MAG TPA: hypothetical protein VEL51_09360 [Vicinamibacterales bacterium]|nr:hypothetical protein [Vicinamibacterales bacterium]